MIKKYFQGVGNITKHGSDSLHYQVRGLRDLTVIIDHFDKYPINNSLIPLPDLPSSSIMLEEGEAGVP